jgi:hypothetical protein
MPPAFNELNDTIANLRETLKALEAAVAKVAEISKTETRQPGADPESEEGPG